MSRADEFRWVKGIAEPKGGYLLPRLLYLRAETNNQTTSAYVQFLMLLGVPTPLQLPELHAVQFANTHQVSTLFSDVVEHANNPDRLVSGTVVAE